MKYNFSKLGLSRNEINDLETISNIKSILSLIFLYLSTILIIFISIFIFKTDQYYYLTPFFLILIASRIGAFLNLMHEASHNVLFTNIKYNNLIAKWLLGCPIGINFYDYTKRHLHHHAHTTTSKEPESDKDKYEEVNVKSLNFLKFCLYDIIGYSAFKVFFSIGEKNVKKPNKIKTIKNLINIIIIQFLILLIFKFDLLLYFIFWIYPIIGLHMLLMRIRGIAEHGLSKQINKEIQNVQEGLLYTRSFLTPSNNYRFKIIFYIEKFLIGTFNVNYHHEHHLCPKIPHYNLKKLHNKISKEILSLNNRAFEKGYFTAVFKK